ncbi:MAG: sulfite exporter TauE/SafE family protein [Chloroflexota bacterium]|nr:sulfite exporter TauE/SafE family protein [Chloroflexota bacterium]
MTVAIVILGSQKYQPDSGAVLSPPRHTIVKIIWYLLAGAIAGTLAGILGIGGGTILVPVLTTVLLVNQHKAHGSSLAIVVPIAVTGTIVYALRGDINWTLAATIASTSILGAIIGAKLMMRISAHRLRQIFGIYTITIALLLFFR